MMPAPTAAAFISCYRNVLFLDTLHVLATHVQELKVRFLSFFFLVLILYWSTADKQCCDGCQVDSKGTQPT